MIKYTIKNLHLAIWQTMRMAGYELFIVTNLPYQCCNKEGFAADVAVGDIMKKKNQKNCGFTSEHATSSKSLTNSVKDVH